MGLSSGIIVLKSQEGTNKQLDIRDDKDVL